MRISINRLAKCALLVGGVVLAGKMVAGSRTVRRALGLRSPARDIDAFLEANEALVKAIHDSIEETKTALAFQEIIDSNGL